MPAMSCADLKLLPNEKVSRCHVSKRGCGDGWGRGQHHQGATRLTRMSTNSTIVVVDDLVNPV